MTRATVDLTERETNSDGSHDAALTVDGAFMGRRPRFDLLTGGDPLNNAHQET